MTGTRGKDGARARGRLQGEGRGTELVPGDEGDEYCASLICEFRFDTDLADKYIIIYRQSSRDERNAREAHGNYIIKNVKEESTEYTEESTDYMDPAKFNHKMNVSLQFMEQRTLSRPAR